MRSALAGTQTPSENNGAGVRVVGSVFWPSGVIEPLPGLFVGPTGNRVALGKSNKFTLARVAMGRFGAMLPCGVGRSTQSDQQA
jgi:hypothetical protein